jgi:hypothetical protein
MERMNIGSSMKDIHYETLAFQCLEWCALGFADASSRSIAMSMTHSIETSALFSEQFLPASA